MEAGERFALTLVPLLTRIFVCERRYSKKTFENHFICANQTMLIPTTLLRLHLKTLEELFACFVSNDWNFFSKTWCFFEICKRNEFSLFSRMHIPSPTESKFCELTILSLIALTHTPRIIVLESYTKFYIRWLTKTYFKIVNIPSEVFSGCKCNYVHLSCNFFLSIVES